MHRFDPNPFCVHHDGHMRVNALQVCTCMGLCQFDPRDYSDCSCSSGSIISPQCQQCNAQETPNHGIASASTRMVHNFREVPCNEVFDQHRGQQSSGSSTSFRMHDPSETDSCSFENDSNTGTTTNFIDNTNSSLVMYTGDPSYESSLTPTNPARLSPSLIASTNMNSTQDHSDYLFRRDRHLLDDPSSSASWGHSSYISSSDAASRLCNKAPMSSCLRSTSLININDDGRLAAGADPAIYSDPSASQRSETSSVKESKQSAGSIPELDAGHPTVQRPSLGPETQHFYIGARTRAEAEAAVKRRTTFRLYHQWDPSATVLERLPLTIIYRSSRGKHYHFLVRSEGKIDPASGSYVPAKYFIETGGPHFTHLKDLVVRYSNNTYIRGDDMDCFYVPLE